MHPAELNTDRDQLVYFSDDGAIITLCENCNKFFQSLGTTGLCPYCSEPLTVFVRKEDQE